MRDEKTVITPDYEGKDTDMYPAYRYQDYGTKPTVVYVQSVEEADDLIPCLKQYVPL